MVSSIVQGLLPLAIKFILMAIEKNILNNEQAKAYLDFLQTMATGDNQSQKSKVIFSELHDQLRLRVVKEESK